MGLFAKLFGQKAVFKKTYSYIHRWMNGEQQLEMHRNATNIGLSFKDRVKVVEQNLMKAYVERLKLYGGKDIKLNKFAKYIVKMKNQ